MLMRALSGRILPAVVLVTAISWPVAAVEAVAPAEFGEPFPPATLENLNEGVGGTAEIALGRIIGKKPILLYFWIPGNKRSEEVFQQVQEVADEFGPSKLVLYGVTRRPDLTREQIVERIRELKIHVPVLHDTEFVIGQRLGVRTVPSISILDGEGKLRLANGGSLRQTLEYKMDMEAAIRRVANTGRLGTYGSMPKWYPVTELVGQECPDFEAPLLSDGQVRRWSGLIESDSVNVIAFWSVDCPHCRETLPELNQWLKKNADGINFVTAAKIENEAVRIKTLEFCKSNELAFPTFVDEGRKIAEPFQVISTPTFVIVRPDGVVDSVILSGLGDLGKTLEAKKKELLKTNGS